MPEYLRLNKGMYKLRFVPQTNGVYCYQYKVHWIVEDRKYHPIIHENNNTCPICKYFSNNWRIEEKRRLLLYELMGRVKYDFNVLYNGSMQILSIPYHLMDRIIDLARNNVIYDTGSEGHEIIINVECHGVKMVYDLSVGDNYDLKMDRLQPYNLNRKPISRYEMIEILQKSDLPEDIVKKIINTEERCRTYPEIVVEAIKFNKYKFIMES